MLFLFLKFEQVFNQIKAKLICDMEIAKWVKTFSICLQICIWSKYIYRLLLSYEICSIFQAPDMQMFSIYDYMM